MASMRTANRSNVGRMARGSKPIVDRSPDPATRDRRITRPMVAGDQQNQPITTRDGLIEPAIDRSPGTIEIETMKIEGGIGFDDSAAQAFVPCSVEGSVCDRNMLWRG